MIRRLSEDVRGRLRTGVALTGVAQCVEELVLNSVDAGATCVAVRVDLQSLMIQVVDNGAGIAKEQLPYVGERYSTSKCHTVEDLDNLRYFGYRGEALASLCSASTFVEIITKPALSAATYSKCFHKGKPLTVTEPNTPRPGRGTTVTAHNLFYNLPVRKKLVKEGLELEKIRYRVAGLALIWPLVSFSLRDDITGNVILQTRKCSGLLATFSSLFGGARAKHMREVWMKGGEFKVSGYVSRENYSRKDLQFVFVNRRLVLKSKVHKMLNTVLGKSVLVRRRGGDRNSKQERSPAAEGGSPTKMFERYAVYVINIDCPFVVYDITFDPSKTLVEFHDWSELTKLIESMLFKFLKEENLLLPSEEGKDGGHPSTSANVEDSASMDPDKVHESDDPFAGAEEGFDEEFHNNLQTKSYTQGISTLNNASSLSSLAVRRPAERRLEGSFVDTEPSSPKKKKLENDNNDTAGQKRQDEDEPVRLYSSAGNVETFLSSERKSPRELSLITTKHRGKVADEQLLPSGQHSEIGNGQKKRESFSDIRDSPESMDEDRDTEIVLPQAVRPSKRVVTQSFHQQASQNTLQAQNSSSNSDSSLKEIRLPSQFAQSSSLSRLRARLAGEPTPTVKSQGKSSAGPSGLHTYRQSEKRDISRQGETREKIESVNSEDNVREIFLPPKKRLSLFKSKSLDAKSSGCQEEVVPLKKRSPDAKKHPHKSQSRTSDDISVNYGSVQISEAKKSKRRKSEESNLMTTRYDLPSRVHGTHRGSAYSHTRASGSSVTSHHPQLHQSRHKAHRKDPTLHTSSNMRSHKQPASTHGHKGTPHPPRKQAVQAKQTCSSIYTEDEVHMPSTSVARDDSDFQQTPEISGSQQSVSRAEHFCTSSSRLQGADYSRLNPSVSKPWSLSEFDQPTPRPPTFHESRQSEFDLSVCGPSHNDQTASQSLRASHPVSTKPDADHTRQGSKILSPQMSGGVSQASKLARLMRTEEVSSSGDDSAGPAEMDVNKKTIQPTHGNFQRLPLSFQSEQNCPSLCHQEYHVTPMSQVYPVKEPQCSNQTATAVDMLRNTGSNQSNTLNDRRSNDTVDLRRRFPQLTLIETPHTALKHYSRERHVKDASSTDSEFSAYHRTQDRSLHQEFAAFDLFQTPGEGAVNSSFSGQESDVTTGHLNFTQFEMSGIAGDTGELRRGHSQAEKFNFAAVYSAPFSAREAVSASQDYVPENLVGSLAPSTRGQMSSSGDAPENSNLLFPEEHAVSSQGFSLDPYPFNISPSPTPFSIHQEDNFAGAYPKELSQIQQDTQGFSFLTSQGFVPQLREEGSLPFTLKSKDLFQSPAGKRQSDSPMSTHSAGFSPAANDPLLSASDDRNCASPVPGSMTKRHASSNDNAKETVSSAAEVVCPQLTTSLMGDSSSEKIDASNDSPSKQESSTISTTVIEGKPDSRSSLAAKLSQAKAKVTADEDKNAGRGHSIIPESNEDNEQAISSQSVKSSDAFISHPQTNAEDSESHSTAQDVIVIAHQSVHTETKIDLGSIEIQEDVHFHLQCKNSDPDSEQKTASQRLLLASQNSASGQLQHPGRSSMASTSENQEEGMVLTGKSEIPCAQRVVISSTASASYGSSAEISSTRESTISLASSYMPFEIPHSKDNNVSQRDENKVKEKQTSEESQGNNQQREARTSKDYQRHENAASASSSSDRTASSSVQGTLVSSISSQVADMSRSDTKREMVVERTYNLSFLSGRKFKPQMTSTALLSTKKTTATSVGSSVCSEIEVQETPLCSSDAEEQKSAAIAPQQSDGFSNSVPDCALISETESTNLAAGHAAVTLETKFSQSLPDNELASILAPESHCQTTADTDRDISSQNSLTDSDLARIVMPEHQSQTYTPTAEKVAIRPKSMLDNELTHAMAPERHACTTAVQDPETSASTQGSVSDDVLANMDILENQNHTGTMPDSNYATFDSVPDDVIVHALTQENELLMADVSAKQVTAGTSSQVLNQALTDSFTQVTPITSAVSDNFTQNAYKLQSALSPMLSSSSAESNPSQCVSVTQMRSQRRASATVILGGEKLDAERSKHAVGNISAETEQAADGCQGYSVQRGNNNQTGVTGGEGEEDEGREGGGGPATEVQWIPVTDPLTGATVYMNSRSGHTLTQAQWNEMDMNLEQHDNNYQNQRQTTSTKTPKQTKIQELSPLSRGTLEALLADHFEADDEESRLKWREGSKHMMDEDSGGRSVSDILSTWENPVFRKPEQILQTATRSQAGKVARTFFPPTTFTKHMLAGGKVVGQLDNKFVACLIQEGTTAVASTSTEQNGDGEGLVVLFDQHAAHERVRLEQLISDVYEKDGSGKSEGRRIQRTDVKPPRMVLLSEEDVRIMQSFRGEYDRIGVAFDVDKHHRDRVHIHTIPACISQREANDMKRGKDPLSYEYVEIMIREHNQLLLSTAGARLQLPQQVHRLLATHACKGAIKFGDTVSVSTCQELLSSLSSCDLPFQCAHGRPSIAPLISLRQLKLAASDNVRSSP
ncbi:uncharacterized protein [Littorina saxatilis]|uniref:uncharacterized protein isoform X2 n=1 Tax=Littorina saxatilis TaxID=31220 RepID=UPI0038B542F3